MSTTLVLESRFEQVARRDRLLSEPVRLELLNQLHALCVVGTVLPLH